MGRVDFASKASKRRERSIFLKVLRTSSTACVYNLYRLDFHFIPSSHFPQRGKQEIMFLPIGKYNFAKQNITATAISLCNAKYNCDRQYHLPIGTLASVFAGRRGRRPLRFRLTTCRQSTSFDVIILLLNSPILAFPFGEGGPLAVEEVLRLSKFCNNLCFYV